MESRKPAGKGREATGSVTATLATPAGTEHVEVALDSSERSLGDAIHAAACASREAKPGRTLSRTITWHRREPDEVASPEAPFDPAEMLEYAALRLLERGYLHPAYAAALQAGAS
jgi:hypothetical protein